METACPACNASLIVPEDPDVTMPSESPSVAESEASRTPWGEETDSLDPSVRMIGKCRIEHEIGRGGMGAVYLGHHTRLDVPVAVKVLPPHIAESDPEFVHRFVREARLAARIRHPNIVSVLDVDQEQETGQYYIVQEYVAGGSLKDLLDEGPMETDRATEIVLGVAEALNAAAKYDIIHRDIKPDNIMLTTDGTAKLADLGLAKSTTDDAGMTMTSAVMGTPAYMAPEQVESTSSVDARADIYSLGATFYHMVTGKRPFSGPTPASIMLKHLQEPLSAVRDVKADVPEPVAAIIEKMLAKNPAERFQTAAELVTALKSVGEGQTPAFVTAAHAEKTAKRRQFILAGCAAAGLLLIAGITAVVLHRKGVLSLPGVVSGPPGYDLWGDKGQDEIGYWGENEHGMKFRWIAPGELKIEDRVLAVTNGYWIQTTEVTQGQWEALGATNPSKFKSGPDYPVEQVSWNDCMDFARKLGEIYRLPTNDEWEYACRAGSKTAYCMGDSETFLGEYAWYNANSGGKTHPAAKKKPNAWGLYDMHGNVWEWVYDADPKGRVRRGGSWHSHAGNCRSANRHDYHPGYRGLNFGFRVVVTR